MPGRSAHQALEYLREQCFEQKVQWVLEVWRFRAGELIVVDIFPQRIADRYWGDMTRTYPKGRASDAQRRLVRTVRRAHRLAMAMIKPGVRGGKVHQTKDSAAGANQGGADSDPPGQGGADSDPPGQGGADSDPPGQGGAHGQQEPPRMVAPHRRTPNAQLRTPNAPSTVPQAPDVPHPRKTCRKKRRRASKKILVGPGEIAWDGQVPLDPAIPIPASDPAPIFPPIRTSATI